MRKRIYVTQVRVYGAANSISKTQIKTNSRNENKTRARICVFFCFFLHRFTYIQYIYIRTFRSIFVFRARLRHVSRVFGVSALCLPVSVCVVYRQNSLVHNKSVYICMSTCWTQSRIKLLINCLKGNKAHGITTTKHCKTLRNTQRNTTEANEEPSYHLCSIPQIKWYAYVFNCCCFISSILYPVLTTVDQQTQCATDKQRESKESANATRFAR